MKKDHIPSALADYLAMHAQQTALRTQLGELKKQTKIMGTLLPELLAKHLTTLDKMEAQKLLDNLYWNYPSPVEMLRDAHMAAFNAKYIPTPIVRKVLCDCGKFRLTVTQNNRNSGIKGHTRCSRCRKEADEQRARREQQWENEHTRELAEIEKLRVLPYTEYLKSEHWQATRKKALYRAGYCCFLCGTNNTMLDVHHRTYERLGYELNCDLVVLCRACHERHHGKVGA